MFAPAAHAAVRPVTWCGDATSSTDRPDVVGGDQIHVVYAVPSDSAGRFAQVASAIATDVGAIGEWWRRQDPTRAPRFDLARFACSGAGSLDISDVRLPHPSAYYNQASVPRFAQHYAALVGRAGAVDGNVADAFLNEAGAALSPVIEREHLLEHSSARERTLGAAAERRLMRLGFDLHDGPIQDVLALAAEVRLLQQQLYPFVLAEHREQAYGRFDDLTARGHPGEEEPPGSAFMACASAIVPSFGCARRACRSSAAFAR